MKSMLPVLLLLAVRLATAQDTTQLRYWNLSPAGGIVWDLTRGTGYPHSDNVELSGRQVSAILYYTLGTERELGLRREIIYPQLRTYAQGWKRYRAYRRLTFAAEVEPAILMDTLNLAFGKVDSVRINGIFTLYHTPLYGIRLTRTLLPSMSERLFAEHWTLTNRNASERRLRIGRSDFLTEMYGIKGRYTNRVYHDAPEEMVLQPGATGEFTLYFAAAMENEPTEGFSYDRVRQERELFLESMQENLVLESASPLIDRLFYFSKIRAAESLFDSRMGLVHSPGGGNYYAGIWANDQVEYSGPLFPLLGYPPATGAAKNAYLTFMQRIPEGDGPISSSFEMEGDLPCCGADRGDAAMIAYGTSLFLLRNGDPAEARELWPLVTWSLDYCQRKINANGVVESATDEMEGRISTGTANLSTNALCYGGLVNAARVARGLGYDSLWRRYSRLSETLAQSIESHFGYTIDGLATYRYFEGNTRLRHWICLPLVMGINTRAEATSVALLDRLWTANGVLVERNPETKDPPVFWDRGTLYALRGTFRAGYFDKSLEKLLQYSAKRLLGDHVPYAVEAWPENNMKHLSAESALYCRMVIEGMLGFEQTSFDAFTFTPQLSEKLPWLNLTNLHLGTRKISITLRLTEGQIETRVYLNGKKITDRRVKPGERIEVKM